MRATSYPTYKDSGIEWLGQIPAHWESSKIYGTCTVKARLGWKGLKAEEYVDEGFIFLSTPNIKGVGIDFDDVNYITEERYAESPEIMLQVGDVLLAKDGSTLGIVNVVRNLPRPATVNSSIAVVRPDERLFDSVYLSYFLSSRFTQSVIERMKGGMGVPHLFQADIRKFRLLAPSVEEQQAIADVLDRETAKIDALVEKKERLIELLQEKRTALITHAVTKGLPAAAAAQAGLDPDVPMKDSGIEWLGQIPAHWSAAPIKRLTRIVNGATPRSGETEYWDGDIVWATPDDLGQLEGIILQDTSRHITDEGYASCGTALVPSGTLVLSTRAPIGHLAIAGCAMCMNQGCRGLVPSDGVPPNYRYYSLLAAKPVLQSLGQGSTFQELSREKLASVPVPNPDITEQRAIADFLDRETAKIDALIAKIGEAIERLKEYRIALISATVTGKIDVREESEGARTSRS